MSDFNKEPESRRDYSEGTQRRYSSEGRVLRSRRNYSASSSENAEHRQYNSDRPRRNFQDSEHRPYNAERRSYNSDRPRRPYGTDRPRRNFSQDGEQERRPYNGEHRQYDSERRQYSSDRPRRNFSDSEHRPYNAERRPYNQDRQSEGGERPYRSNFSSSSERRPSYGAQRRPYGGDSQRRPYGGGRPQGRGYNQNRQGNGGYRKSYEPRFNEGDDSGINKMLSRKPQLDNMKFSDSDMASTFQEEIRLNKFIANSGVCSRREADTYIQAGVVTVNGEVVTELGTKVNVLNDDVRFNGERLKGEEKVYIVMNKPKGYVTTASDPHADRTVMDLLKGCTARVFPVGRLDKATTGVLMFTNDGEVAEKLTHPSYDKKKIYQVILDHDLKQEDYDKILSGITLPDGEVSADELEYIDEADHRKLGIEIHSGKNRIVRRIFESLGYDVRALDRVYFAGLTKKGLQKGEWRYLTEGEINILKIGAYM